MIDDTRPHPVERCEVCDDDDHCLPRWEDDGGPMGRPQPSVQAFEAESERDEGHHDRPHDGQSHQSI
jgi:hypothetical protein